MSRKLTIRRTVACPPDRLLAAISDRDFLVARHRAQGAIEVMARDVARSAGRLVQEVTVKEPAHTMHGIDARKLESSVTTYSWNLSAGRGTWSYRGPHQDLVMIEGSFLVEADGRGSSLRADFEVSVRAPLFGRLIEKRIIQEIEAAQPRVDAVVEEFLGRR